MIVALKQGNAEEAQKESEDLLQQVKLAEEEDHLDPAAAYADVSSAPLDPEMVYKARMGVSFTRDMKLPLSGLFRRHGLAALNKFKDMPERESHSRSSSTHGDSGVL